MWLATDDNPLDRSITVGLYTSATHTECGLSDTGDNMLMRIRNCPRDAVPVGQRTCARAALWTGLL